MALYNRLKKALHDGLKALHNSLMDLPTKG
jgi:hypothetical protein